MSSYVYGNYQMVISKRFASISIHLYEENSMIQKGEFNCLGVLPLSWYMFVYVFLPLMTTKLPPSPIRRIGRGAAKSEWEYTYCAEGFGRVTSAPIIHKTASAPNRATCFQCDAVAGAEVKGWLIPGVA